MKSSVGHYEPIAREGHIFIAPPAVLAVMFWLFGHPWASLAFLLIATAVALFFRNPERNTPRGEGLVTSPCDGRVMQILPGVESRRIPDTRLTRISIFMSIFNVHVNRSPVSGAVKGVEHTPGRFLDARDPDSSLINENNSVTVSAEEAVDQGAIEVVQIAGKVARRIACWVREGDRLRRGERFGLIRFGSRVDVYLPEEFAFVVDIGAKVKAGETIIARRKDL